MPEHEYKKMSSPADYYGDDLYMCKDCGHVKYVQKEEVKEDAI